VWAGRGAKRCCVAACVFRRPSRHQPGTRTSCNKFSAIAPNNCAPRNTIHASHERTATRLSDERSCECVQQCVAWQTGLSLGLGVWLLTGHDEWMWWWRQELERSSTTKSVRDGIISRARSIPRSYSCICTVSSAERGVLCPRTVLAATHVSPSLHSTIRAVLESHWPPKTRTCVAQCMSAWHCCN
jgi:hypothetical protein